MYFDSSVDMPKLFFKAVRALDEQELEVALKQKKQPCGKHCCTTNHSDTRQNCCG
jgi:hypothetical protein